jgi:hypothetical protein
MTDRPTADTITDQELDALYTDADRSEEAIGELNEHVINFQRRAERAELALTRVHHLADLIAAGAPWTANHTELATRIREAATVPPAPAATQATSSAGQLRDLLAAVLGAFPDSGPDGPAIRSRPLPAELVHRWKQQASGAQPEPKPELNGEDGGLLARAADAIRDAACNGECGQDEEECRQERIQPFAWHHGRLAIVEGTPEMFAAAVLPVALADQNAAFDRVRALADRLEECAENALRTDDRDLYAAIARELHTAIQPDEQTTEN